MKTRLQSRASFPSCSPPPKRMTYERLRTHARAGRYRIDHRQRGARRATTSTTTCAASPRAIDGHVERIEVEPHRFNVFAQWGEPLVVTLSTHIDTVPPFFPSREDDDFIWGRGACDTKGIIASMIKAAEALLEARRAQLRPAVRGRRGAQQRRRLPGRARRRAARATSSTASPPRTSSRSARKARCATKSCAHRQDGALRLSRAGRFGHRQTARRAGRRSAQIPLPVDAAARAEHAEHRHHLRRPRAQRDPRRSPRRDHDPPGGRFRRARKAALARAVDGRAELREVLEIPAAPPGRGRRHSRPPWSPTPPTSRLRRHVGRAVPDRPRHHSRGAHARRARAQSGSCWKQSKSINAWYRNYANAESKSASSAPPAWWASISSSFCRAIRGST